MPEIVNRAGAFGGKTAIVSEGNTYTYAELLRASKNVSLALLGERDTLAGARVVFMVTPGFDYVNVQWGIWRAGGIAVPLYPGMPLPAVEYVLADALAGILVVSAAYRDAIEPLVEGKEIAVHVAEDFSDREGILPDVAVSASAMMLYTSGTTGNPKGVVTTHQHIEAQITTLVKAWQWSGEDRIVNILPLHHVHGIVNVMSCALWSGATCYFLPKFDPQEVFDLIVARSVNLFMAVPTIYFKLIAYWEALDADEQATISAGLADMRLMVSGSAALPVSVLEKWKAISGHTLLERYGMTEIGMAISNPYAGERRPGHIGQPLPGVAVRLVDEAGEPVERGPGEIQVKGPGVFAAYWNRPEATAASFTPDGWFKTGDIGELNAGYYKILGRNSVDIIKSGGYKISALEIEEVLRTHPAVKDCGVVGIPDEEWGEVIGAGVVYSGAPADPEALKTWLRERLSAYKVPRRYLALDDLPRNALGKVTKKVLVKKFTGDV